MLSLLALAYLLFSSGISQVFRILPWWIFIQIGLDALFFIFWIAAAGTSHFTCDDLCTACNIAGYEITYDSLVCACYSSDIDDFIFDKRGLSPNPNPGLSGGLQKRRSRYHSSGGATGTLVAREALDGVCVYVSHFIFRESFFSGCLLSLYSLELHPSSATMLTSPQCPLLRHLLFNRLVDVAKAESR